MSTCSSTAACGLSGNVATDHATVPALYTPNANTHSSGDWWPMCQKPRDKAGASGSEQTLGQDRAAVAAERTACSANVAVGDSGTRAKVAAHNSSAASRRPNTRRALVPMAFSPTRTDCFVTLLASEGRACVVQGNAALFCGPEDETTALGRVEALAHTLPRHATNAPPPCRSPARRARSPAPASRGYAHRRCVPLLSVCRVGRAGCPGGVALCSALSRTPPHGWQACWLLAHLAGGPPRQKVQPQWLALGCHECAAACRALPRLPDGLGVHGQRLWRPLSPMRRSEHRLLCGCVSWLNLQG